MSELDLCYLAIFIFLPNEMISMVTGVLYSFFKKNTRQKSDNFFSFWERLRLLGEAYEYQSDFFTNPNRAKYLDFAKVQVKGDERQ